MHSICKETLHTPIQKQNIIHLIWILDLAVPPIFYLATLLLSYVLPWDSLRPKMNEFGNINFSFFPPTYGFTTQNILWCSSQPVSASLLTLWTEGYILCFIHYYPSSEWAVSFNTVPAQIKHSLFFLTKWIVS